MASKGSDKRDPKPHFNLVEENQNESRWQCRECEADFVGSYTRMVAHLARVKGKGVAICTGKSENALALAVQWKEIYDADHEKKAAKSKKRAADSEDTAAVASGHAGTPGSSHAGSRHSSGQTKIPRLFQEADIAGVHAKVCVCLLQASCCKPRCCKPGCLESHAACF